MNTPSLVIYLTEETIIYTNFTSKNYQKEFFNIFGINFKKKFSCQQLSTPLPGGRFVYSRWDDQTNMIELWQRQNLTIEHDQNWNQQTLTLCPGPS